MSPTPPQKCAGATALGRCDKRAKYRVNERPACGIHMGQAVKWALEDHPTVTVTRANDG